MSDREVHQVEFLEVYEDFQVWTYRGSKSEFTSICKGISSTERLYNLKFVCVLNSTQKGSLLLFRSKAYE